MSHFEIRCEPFSLQLNNVFTISRSSRSEVPVVFIEITKNGITGYGEASPNSRYNESQESVIEYVNNLPKYFWNEIKAPEDLPKKISQLNQKSVYSAQAAIEMAWLDWWAKSQDQPLWKLWGYESPVGPVTSFTIGIDTPEKMQAKIREAEQYPIYKIKLGTDRDREIIEAIREVTDKPLRVDANEGWKTLDQAKREIEFLNTQNIELIEQPMPAQEFEKMKELKKWSPLPLAADESFTGKENLEDMAEAFHVINIKLMKIGSLVKARKVIREVKELGLQIMIGCMIESSLANAAGALVALETDYVDLDGHLLIGNDPFSGLGLNSKHQVVLSDESGFGVNRLK